MVITDTSVCYKWFDENEVDFKLAYSILESHLTQKNKIVIPDLLLYELSNAWATKSALNEDHIKENLNLFKRYKIDVIPVDFSLIEKAIDLSKEKKVSVYDAIYIALAKEKECLLITADEKLVDKINLPFVVKLFDYTEKD